MTDISIDSYVEGNDLHADFSIAHKGTYRADSEAEAVAMWFADTSLRAELALTALAAATV